MFRFDKFVHIRHNEFNFWFRFSNKKLCFEVNIVDGDISVFVNSWWLLLCFSHDKRAWLTSTHEKIVKLK